jgi:DNA-binding beta-propeller fold protein YncE
MTSGARAAALSGSTLVVSAGSEGLLALDLAGARPVVLGVFGGHGREALQFVRPAGAAIDAAGDAVLVSDGGNDRLVWLDLARASGGPSRYDPTRTRFSRSIFFGDEEALVFGAIPWTLSPALLHPGAIARDERGVTYVLDALYGRVVVLDPSFRPLRSWGSHGEGDGRFLDPVDVALAPSGETLYVLDAGTGRVQAFDRSGRRLFAWGRLGSGREAFIRPRSLAVAGDGSVLVADRAGRVDRFTSRGKALAGWGRPGSAPGWLDHPERILAGGKGRSFVLDAGGRRLQAFTTSGRFLWDLDVIAAAIEARRTSATTIAKGSVAESPPPGSPADTGRPPAGCPRRVTSNAGAYTVCWSPSIDPPPHNAPFAIEVSVYDTARPAAPAEMVALTFDASMPEHGHGLVQPPVVRAIGPSIPREKLPDHALAHGAAVGNGRFVVQDLRLHMPGRWEIDFDIGRGAVIERAQVEITLD